MNAAMRDYYNQRAAEYDDWWLGTGLFADRDRPGWDEDRAALIAALQTVQPRRTLDLACGTGFLTQHLPGEVTGVDQSARMVARAKGRGVHAVVGNALVLPPVAYDRIFTAHFYGHLDAAQRAELLAIPTSELIVVDSAGGPREAWQERTLNDGSTHSVFKRWFSAESLAAELGGETTVLHDGPWFVAVSSTGRA